VLDVTWEWIALDKAALDVANTVAVENGVEHDLLAPDEEYARWAKAAARSPELMPSEAAAIADSRARVLTLRGQIRAVLKATADGKPLPKPAVATLNKASRSAPEWTEIAVDGRIERRAHGGGVERLLADYARSAMEIAAEGTAGLRVCGAPSCGMFYRPRRRQQRWCSEPCGNRARFARHYARRTEIPV